MLKRASSARSREAATVNRHGRQPAIFACFVSISLTVLAPHLSADELRGAVAVDGERFQAELVAADADWNLTFRAGKDERRIAASELVSWGSPVEPKGRATIRICGLDRPSLRGARAERTERTGEPRGLYRTRRQQ